MIGLFLVIRGQRGKKLDDHPICRKCKYDLSGSPDAADCPECGSDLLAASAVLTGNRQKQNGYFVFGSLLIVVSIYIFIAQLSGINLNNYKPVWLLRYEAARTMRSSDNEALNELLQRARNGALHTSQLDALLNDILTIQTDMTVPVNPTWAVLYNELHGQGIGTQAQHNQFKQATLYSNNAMAAKVKNAIITPKIIVDAGLASTFSQSSSHIHLDYTWRFPSQPFKGTFYYQVVIRSNGKDWPTSMYISANPPSQYMAYVSSSIPTRIIPDRVDLIFRPDPQAAMKQEKYYRILDHEFIIEDVEVVRQP